MKPSRTRFGLSINAALMFASLVLTPLLAGAAEDAEKLELAKQEAFRNGVEAIVADLNSGSYQSFISAIDRRAMIERIYGLRLIDQQVKKQFSSQMEGSFGNMIESEFAAPEEGLKATLLGIESRGDRGRAVVRFDYPKFEFNYHEYDLLLDAQNRLIVVDWTDYIAGIDFSDSVGQLLIMSAPSKSAMRKLLDFQNVNDRDLFEFGELLKAARDTQLDRYLEIHGRLEPRFQRQRIVVETSVRVARQARKRRQMIGALGIMAEMFPDEPLYALMLLDYYFPARKYEEAMRALQSLSEQLDFPDAAMDARMSAAALVMGKPQDAAALADRALEIEPGLELAWWSALGARVELADFKGSVEILQKLESEFGWDLGPDKLKKNRQYAQLLASAEFKSWVESKQQN